VLQCLEGTIWLTKGDGADHLVHRGHRFVLAVGETAVVEALGSAEVRLESAARERGGSAPILVLNAAGY
jgi:quercetin dioxygenase-like cupin family protein